VLLTAEIGVEVALEGLLVCVCPNRRGNVVALMLLYLLSLVAGLFLEVGQLLELRPYKISLLYLVSNGEPYSPADQPGHHAGIVALTHVHLQPVLVLHWSLNEETVRIVGLPDEVAVVVGRKRGLKLLPVFLYLAFSG
jgi:hypothetical protein